MKHNYPKHTVYYLEVPQDLRACEWVAVHMMDILHNISDQGL